MSERDFSLILKFYLYLLLFYFLKPDFLGEMEKLENSYIFRSNSLVWPVSRDFSEAILLFGEECLGKKDFSWGDNLLLFIKVLGDIIGFLIYLS